MAEKTATTPLELRRNVIPMFKEILHNVNRHARASSVNISGEFSSHDFLLKVHDDGIGFDETKVPAGNGLRNLRRRAADLKGTLLIESRPGHGTTIVLKSPIT